MKKIITIALAIVLVLTLGATGVFAGTNTPGQPSAKATCKVGDIHILDSTGMDWTTILSNDIKVPSQKDLFIDVSLESGLYTRTLVKSKNLTSDTSLAEAVIEVQVLVDSLVDSYEAYPGEVVFNARTQTLTAKFAGYIEDTNGNGILDVGDEVTEEELELILDTMSANSFNFILDDLPQGTYTISVQARIDTATSYQAGAAEAKATIGNGSVTVEAVRMIQGEDILLSE